MMKQASKILLVIIAIGAIFFMGHMSNRIALIPPETKTDNPFQKVGQIANKTGLHVEFFELKTNHFVCVVPVHTYATDHRSAVPFVHCERQ